MKSKIYISGKISGMDFKEAKEIFASAFLRLTAVGFMPVNPIWIKPLFGISKYWLHMIADICQLLKCDSIYMLNGWHLSRGARIEMAFALLLKKTVIFEEDKPYSFKIPEKLQEEVRIGVN